MNKAFSEIIVISITTFIILIASIFLVETSHGQELKDSIIRLHVLANSDKTEDQQLKMALKEEILNYMADSLEAAASTSEIRTFIETNHDELTAFSEAFIQAQGYDYPVSIELTTCYFPTKAYGDMVFPCGEYEALRILIGEAKGQNWWCVLYPPLCFIGTEEGIVPPESKQLLQNLLSTEDYEMLSINNYDQKDVQIKFKLLELFK